MGKREIEHMSAIGLDLLSVVYFIGNCELYSLFEETVACAVQTGVISQFALLDLKSVRGQSELAHNLILQGLINPYQSI